MKKVIVGLLFIGVLVMGYFTYNVVCDNRHIKDKINVLSESIKTNEQEKNIYESKKKQLDEIKESNKDKSSKYDEVDAWNQEIIKYLDQLLHFYVF